METHYNVVIVSCFGRGNWLASELRAKGLKIALIDISERLGVWAAEDWEGPFGCLRSEELKETQVGRLHEDDSVISVDNGFTLWTASGPIEMKGALAPFLLEKTGISHEAQDYLRQFNSLSRQQKEGLKQKLSEQVFEQTWLAHFSHQLAANVYKDNAYGMSYGQPLAINSPYFARRVSRKGQAKALQLCRDRGVAVFPHANLVDFDCAPRVFRGLEVASEWSGAVQADSMVWMLSSEESARLPESVYSVFFQGPPVKATWAWVRYRFELQNNWATDVLPVKFFMIRDIFLPWAGSNVVAVEKTAKETDVDAWVKIPIHQRFQRPYLEEVCGQIVELFQKRLPETQVTCSEMPQEHRYDYADLGPPRFPVYERNPSRQVQTVEYRNVFFDGPEHWQNLDWVGQFQHQNKIYKQIMTAIHSPSQDLKEHSL